MHPPSPEYRVASGADQRLRGSGILFERYQPLSPRHAQELLFQKNDAETAEVYQALEQTYDLPQRDPLAYRPFVEFCFGLPVEMFMRDGQMGWLAKQMAKGIMPEEQRINRLNGRWDADRLLRIRRRRADYLEGIDRLEGDERMAGVLDLPQMRAALENLPEQTELDPQKYFGPEFAVPRGLLAARFTTMSTGATSPEKHRAAPSPEPPRVKCRENRLAVT